MTDQQQTSGPRQSAVRWKWAAWAIAATGCIVVFSFWVRDPEATVAVLGCAFAAFCLWLGVRIVNRRERWAIRLAVCLAVAVVAYPLSWGLWLRCLPVGIRREHPPAPKVFAWGFYAPLIVVGGSLPDGIRDTYSAYIEWAAWSGRPDDEGEMKIIE